MFFRGRDYNLSRILSEGISTLRVYGGLPIDKPFHLSASFRATVATRTHVKELNFIAFVIYDFHASPTLCLWFRLCCKSSLLPKHLHNFGSSPLLLNYNKSSKIFSKYKKKYYFCSMAYQQIRIHLPYWLKRQALADALAQSKGNLSTWLSGSRSISDADLDRIAAFMHAISEHAEQVADQIYGLKVSDKEEMHPDNDQEWAQAQLEQIKFFFKKISEKT